MLKKRIAAVLLTGAVALAAAAPKNELVLIDNGKSDYVIAVPDGPDPRERVGKAAESLQSYLTEATGCKLPIMKESAVPKGKPAFWLGHTKKAVEAGIPFDKLVDWVHCKKAVGKDIFLAGLDASGNISGPMEYHDREYLGQLNGLNLQEKDRSYKEWRGTHKAVLSFLQNEAGVRFLLPGPNGRYVPKIQKLTVPADLNYLGAARFQYSYGRCYGDRDTTIALNHNDIPYYKNYGGHSFPVAVPRHLYGKTHPEYYVMVKGVRRPDYGPGGANHLCVSNPEVQELMMAELEKKYKMGYRWIQVAQTDGLVPCECEECRKLGKGDTGELLWIVYRKIAVEMKKRHPDLKLVFLSYGDTKKPPKTFTDFPDNVIIEYCIWSDFDKKFKEWENFAKVPKVTYIYFWGSYNALIFSPCRSLDYLAKNLRIMADNNVLGIFKCGWGTALGLEGPAYYVFSQLLNDPSQDPKVILNDFCRAAYGKSANLMERFFNSLYGSLDTAAGHPVIDELETRPRNPEQLHNFVYRPGLIKYLDHLLWLSLNTDRDPKVQARLKLVKREFDYLKARVTLYSLMDSFRLTNAPALIPVIEKELKTRDALVDSWYDAKGKMKHEPGFEWPFLEDRPKNIILYGGLEVINPFPAELSKGIEPLKKALNMTTKPEDFKVLAAKIPNEAALKTFFATMGRNPASFGGNPVTTLFKAATDKDNLYLFVECNLDKYSDAYFDAWVKSPLCRDNESLEIYLDVNGDRKKFHHFLVNPLTKNTSEGRRGFRDDPLHPDFGREDKTWNGKWKIETSIDKARKCWFARITIPFATLGTTSPAPGSFWNMNLVRRHYPVGFKDSTTQVSAWSQLPGEDDFGNPECYGKLDFQ